MGDPRADKFMHTPTHPFSVSPNASTSEILERMAKTGFQARNLGHAARIWTEMLQEETTIFFGLSGAMVPAGLRQVIVYLIENRMIDCIVSTGANLFHDFYETLGWAHFQGTPHVDDNELRDAGIYRMYDVYAAEALVIRGDDMIADFSRTIPTERPLTTREFLYLLGRHLGEIGKNKGILWAAAEAGVPIYSPSIADSEFGMALASDKLRDSRLILDTIRDVVEIATIVRDSKATGIVAIGGGTPRNFIQQAAVSGSIFGTTFPGHKYGVHITTDVPHWGGLSGSTFQEAQSWKKFTPDAKLATVYSDATIALPLLVTAVAERCQKTIASRRKPNFVFGPQLETVTP